MGCPWIAQWASPWASPWASGWASFWAKKILCSENSCRYTSSHFTVRRFLNGRRQETFCTGMFVGFSQEILKNNKKRPLGAIRCKTFSTRFSAEFFQLSLLFGTNASVLGLFSACGITCHAMLFLGRADLSLRRPDGLAPMGQGLFNIIKAQTG